MHTLGPRGACSVRQTSSKSNVVGRPVFHSCSLFASSYTGNEIPTAVDRPIRRRSTESRQIARAGWTGSGVAASRPHVIRRKLPNLGWRTAIKNLDFANPFFALKTMKIDEFGSVQQSGYPDRLRRQGLSNPLASVGRSIAENLPELLQLKCRTSGLWRNRR
jgi:hypothetical protein